MGCIPYQTVRDAQQCLNRNVVLYKNLPYYVIEVHGGTGVCGPERINLSLIPLPLDPNVNRTSVSVALTDDDLNVSNIQIGFVNEEWDAMYCSRIPIRGNDQALTERNVGVYNITHTGAERRGSFSLIITKPNFLHQFNGDYPTVETILDVFDKSADIRSRAFNRHYAISRDTFRKDFVVHYRQNPVGHGTLKDRVLTLVPEYSYLKERFTEAGFNVAC